MSLTGVSQGPGSLLPDPPPSPMQELRDTHILSFLDVAQFTTKCSSPPPQKRAGSKEIKELDIAGFCFFIHLENGLNIDLAVRAGL